MDKSVAIEAMEEKMKPIEQKINRKLATCDQKLERIKKLAISVAEKCNRKHQNA